MDIRPHRNRVGTAHNMKGEAMSIEEAVPGNHAIDAQALGDLIDNEGIAAEVTEADDITRRLLDQARYQHLVLAEIYDLSDPKSKTPLADMEMIRVKASAALRSATKSGLLS